MPVDLCQRFDSSTLTTTFRLVWPSASRFGWPSSIRLVWARLGDGYAYGLMALDRPGLEPSGRAAGASSGSSRLTLSLEARPGGSIVADCGQHEKLAAHIEELTEHTW